MGPAPAPWGRVSICKRQHGVLSTGGGGGGSRHWPPLRLREGESAPWSTLFPLESLFWEGPFPEVGGDGQKG